MIDALLAILVVGVVAIALTVDFVTAFAWCWRRARSVQSAVEKPYDAADDFAASINACYAAVRDRVAAGGKGWPHAPDRTDAKRLDLRSKESANDGTLASVPCRSSVLPGVERPRRGPIPTRPRRKWLTRTTSARLS